jgi:hypothetical protein
LQGKPLNGQYGIDRFAIRGILGKAAFQLPSGQSCLGAEMKSTGFEVHFKYWEKEGIGDRDFDAICQTVPRTGELLMGENGGFTIVRQVVYSFAPQSGHSGKTFRQSVCVVIGDLTREESKRLRNLNR